MDASDSILQQIALGILDPKQRMKVGTVRELGLLSRVVKLHYEVFMPQLETLMGWKPLQEFGYGPQQDAYPLEIAQAKDRTAALQREVASFDFGGIRVIELTSKLAREHSLRYRLFVDKLGQLFYYVEGSDWKVQQFKLGHGTIIDLLDQFDADYPTSNVPFFGLLQSFPEALRYSNEQRRLQIETHERLERRLESYLDQLTL